MDMTHGTLAVWHVAEGDLVMQGAALFDIETDKAAMEVEAPVTGRLRQVSAKPGDRVAVGAVIGWIYADGEALAVVPEAVVASAAPAAPTQAAAPTPAVHAAEASSDTQRATPAARKAARDAGVALAEVPGTGPLGRIQRDDVTAVLARQTAAAPSQGWVATSGPLAVTRRASTGAS